MPLKGHSMMAVFGLSTGATGIRIARLDAPGQHDAVEWSYDFRPAPDADRPAPGAAAPVIDDLRRSDPRAVFGLAIVRPELRSQPDAALAAHFVGTRLVGETRAAIRAIRESKIADSFDTIAIYDLGSTGLSVSIVDLDSSVELGAARSTVVSGDFFDRGVREHLISNGILGVPDSPEHDAEVTAFCRGVKESLSSSVLAQTPGGGTMLMSRNQFDQMASLPLEESAKIVSEVGLRCRRTAQAVVVIGGGSRIPLVSTVLSRWLGVPVLVPEEPTLLVAKGAALLVAATEASGDSEGAAMATADATSTASIGTVAPLIADASSLTRFTHAQLSNNDVAERLPGEIDGSGSPTGLRGRLASCWERMRFRSPAVTGLFVLLTVLGSLGLWAAHQSSSDGPADSDGMPESTATADPPGSVTTSESVTPALTPAPAAALDTPASAGSGVAGTSSPARTTPPYRYPANNHVEGSVPESAVGPRETLDVSVPFPLPEIRLPQIPRLSIPGF
ncbi:Hsp70 family protein [Actinomycetes bacterium M1A6_2h]